MNADNRELDIIGSTERISIAGIHNIPAKIDTGADSSSVWASNIHVTEDGILKFCLFDESSPYYTGEVIDRRDYSAVLVRNSSGHEQIRYRTHLPFVINGRKIKAVVTLSDRGNNRYPVLVGRRTISGKFLVDVSINRPAVSRSRPDVEEFQRHLSQDPYGFHRKYIDNSSNHSSNIKKGE